MIDHWLLLLLYAAFLAASTMPLGLMLGSSCSPCCDGDCCCNCTVYVVFDGELTGGTVNAGDPNDPELFPCGSPYASNTTEQQFDDAYGDPLTKCGTVPFYPVFAYELTCANSQFTLTITRRHVCLVDVFTFDESSWQTIDVLTFGCDGSATLVSSNTTEIGDMADCGNCGPNWADYEVFIDCNPLP